MCDDTHLLGMAVNVAKKSQHIRFDQSEIIMILLQLRGSGSLLAQNKRLRIGK